MKREKRSSERTQRFYAILHGHAPQANAGTSIHSLTNDQPRENPKNESGKDPREGISSKWTATNYNLIDMSRQSRQRLDSAEVAAQCGERPGTMRFAGDHRSRRFRFESAAGRQRCVTTRWQASVHSTPIGSRAQGQANACLSVQRYSCKMQSENEICAGRGHLYSKSATLCLPLLSFQVANEFEPRLVAKELVRRWCCGRTSSLAAFGWGWG